MGREKNWLIFKNQTRIRKPILFNTSPMTEKATLVNINGEDVCLSSDYDPLKDSGQYMNKMQLAFFKQKLLEWKRHLELKTEETISNMSADSMLKKSSEEGDMADDEVEVLTQLRSRDRSRKLIHKIDDALVAIETGDYGYCEKSGEPIGIKRLLARPIATLTIEMQKLHEEDEDTKEEAEYDHKIMAAEGVKTEENDAN